MQAWKGESYNLLSFMYVCGNKIIVIVIVIVKGCKSRASAQGLHDPSFVCMIPWKSHDNHIQNHGRTEYRLQNNERSEYESDIVLFLCNDRFWDQL